MQSYMARIRGFLQNSTARIHREFLTNQWSSGGLSPNSGLTCTHKFMNLTLIFYIYNEALQSLNYDYILFFNWVDNDKLGNGFNLF